MTNHNNNQVSDLQLHLYGESKHIKISSDKNILKSLIDAELDPPFSCKIGACSACMAKLVSGKLRIEEHGYLSEEQIAQNYFLACQAYPASDACEISFE